ncbi:STY0301 family protein [Bosea lupini]|nr:STY0301 family protein [Bosea lupini]
MSRILMAAGLFVVLAGEALAAPQCPAEVETQQQLTAAIPGWRDLRSKTPHRVSQVTFYDGQPSEQVSLAPDATRKVRDREVSTWQFASTSERRTWIECGYAGTSISLAQELPAGTKSCSVTYNPKVRLSGLPRIEQLDCK